MRRNPTLTLAGALLFAAPATLAQTPVPVGFEFLVNTYTSDRQLSPAVAVAPDGDFVVVWESDGSPGNDTSSSSIQGQRFAADGNPLGAQFQVNKYTTSRQDSPAVAKGPGGKFVVVWESNGSLGGDTSATSIHPPDRRSSSGKNSSTPKPAIQYGYRARV